MDTLFHLVDLDLAQLALVCLIAFVSSVVSGIAGYGAGLILPVFLAPLVGLMVGLCTSPGAFIARKLLAHIPMKIHLWVMEAVVVIGALTLLWQGIRQDGL